MKKIFYILLLSTFNFQLSTLAQTEPEYLMEIGAGVGMMSYEGDFNGNILKNIQPSADIVLRRMFNPRMGLRFQLDYGRMKGSSAGTKTAYPEYATSQYQPSGVEVYKFSNTLLDLNVIYEYNFWPYGTGKEYRGAKRLTPFVFIGLGMTFVTGGGNNAFAGNLPIGLGVKYKVGKRVNLSLDWTMHFTTSDKLDGVNDPYQIKSKGLFNNKDCYSALMVSVTYSFKEKCRTCHNSDE